MFQLASSVGDICNFLMKFFTGLGLGDILKPDLLIPLIETLPLEQQLASYLPEAYTIELLY